MKNIMKTETFTINGKRIKKRTIPDLPQNLQLTEFARQNRKGHNMAEVMFLEAGAQEKIPRN